MPGTQDVCQGKLQISSGDGQVGTGGGICATDYRVTEEVFNIFFEACILIPHGLDGKYRATPFGAFSDFSLALVYSSLAILQSLLFRMTVLFFCDIL